jgi:SAF domain
VWRTAGLALGLSLLPAASVARVDHLASIRCQVATRDLPRNAVIVPDDLAVKRVRRSDAPRDPVLRHDAVVGRTLATDLKKGDCASLRALRAPLSTVVLPLAGASLLGTPTAGATVDLLFAPSDANDPRNGASIDDVIVVGVDTDRLVVGTTKDQQQTILEYVARSRLVVRAH